MSFLELTEEVLTAIRNVCKMSLKSNDLDAVDHVNAIVAGVKAAACPEAAPVVAKPESLVDQAMPVAEAVIDAACPEAAPVVATAESLVETIEGAVHG